MSCTFRHTTVAFLAAGMLAAADPRPNVVLIMTDDQGVADIGYNRTLHPQGDKLVTPELDRLAKEGLVFTRAYAATPICSPTRASVLTGRHPYRYGVWSYGDPLPAEERSLAQDLAASGYVTGHFGKWHLEGRTGPGIPLTADVPLGPAAFGFQAWVSASNYFDLDATLGSAKGPVATTGDSSDATIALANAFIRSAAKSKRPFLTVIWFGSPHVPLNPLPADLERAGGNAKFGEMIGVDRAVGTLRAQLAAAGVERNTVIWYTSDNGSHDAGGNGNLRGKKGTVWEGGLRVPAIVHWPRRIAPSSSDLPIVTSDIRPTVLALTQTPDGARGRPSDGIDLGPLLAGKALPGRSPICFWYEGKGKVKAPDPKRGHTAVVDGLWKLHRINGQTSLYHLGRDPEESSDLSATEPAVAQRLAKVLERWQESVVSSFAGKDYRKR